MSQSHPYCHYTKAVNMMENLTACTLLSQSLSPEGSGLLVCSPPTGNPFSANLLAGDKGFKPIINESKSFVLSLH